MAVRKKNKVKKSREKAPDFIGYSRAKRKIEDIPLTPQQYEWVCKRLADLYNI